MRKEPLADFLLHFLFDMQAHPAQQFVCSSRAAMNFTYQCRRSEKTRKSGHGLH